MDHRNEIPIELIKLVGGERSMRLTHSPLGLVLDTKLEPQLAVALQKKEVMGVFEAALSKAELSPA